MADKFKSSARKISLLKKSLSQWQNVADHPPISTLEIAPQSSRRKSLIESFKTAVDKVKIKAKIASQFSDEDEHNEEFHTVFHIPHNKKRRVTVLQHFDDETNKNVLKDIPPLTDAEVASFTSTELVGRLLRSRIFRSVILSCIITNSLLIAVETDRNLERKYNRVFKLLDQLMMTIFVCEILLKWYHGFVKFWKQGWNILDFLIVISLIFGPLIMKSSSGGRGVIRILRVLRAFRSLRSISSLPGLQVVVQTILQSVPDMTNIVLLLVIIMLVFAVIGITLFRDIVPRYFGDLSSAMFSLFVCVTQDGWMDIFEAFQEHGENYYYGGGMFLILFISIGAFIFANLVVAVVVTNLECAVKDVKKEEEEQAKELELKGKLDKEIGDEEVEVVKDDDVSSKVFHGQMPFFVPDLSRMDVRNVEHYFLVIGAMEENFRVYQTLKQELTQYFDEICEINKSAMAEGIIAETEEDLTSIKRSKYELLQSYRKASNAGDIISSFMNMEQSNLISTRNKTRITDVIGDSADIASRARLQSTSSIAVMGRFNRRRSSLSEHRRSSLPV